jgi:hypothetical protein
MSYVVSVARAARRLPWRTGHRVSWSDASHVPRACVSCGCPLSDGKQNQHALVPGIAAPLSSLGFWHYQSVSTRLDSSAAGCAFVSCCCPISDMKLEELLMEDPPSVAVRPAERTTAEPAAALPLGWILRPCNDGSFGVDCSARSASSSSTISRNSSATLAGNSASKPLQTDPE